MALPDFDMVNIANKSIYRQIKMLKDMIKARPTSRGMYSVGINTRVGPRPSCGPAGPALGSGPKLVLIPDLVLPSQLVMSIELSKWIS